MRTCTHSLNLRPHERHRRLLRQSDAPHARSEHERWGRCRSRGARRRVRTRGITTVHGDSDWFRAPDGVFEL
jgi:hypothetical protein